MAIGVMEWARQKGIEVPKQLSIVGFDNQLTANYVHPRLTTMHFPAYDMAKACAHFAIREIYHKEQPKGHRFTPHLVERQSVAPLVK
jgi:LacI family transcriptional regulator